MDSMQPAHSTTIAVNQAFIDEHGAPKAEAFMAEVNEVARTYGGHDLDEIADAFDQVLAKIGLTMAAPERAMYIDQIARAPRVTVTADRIDIPDEHTIEKAQADARGTDVAQPANEVTHPGPRGDGAD